MRYGRRTSTYNVDKFSLSLPFATSPWQEAEKSTISLVAQKFSQCGRIERAFIGAKKVGNRESKTWQCWCGNRRGHYLSLSQSLYDLVNYYFWLIMFETTTTDYFNFWAIFWAYCLLTFSQNPELPPKWNRQHQSKPSQIVPRVIRRKL